jgi:Na+-transporting methylmalonyl-CoA/oxaloacetate decarboxylase gamma subunit
MRFGTPAEPGSPESLPNDEGSAIIEFVFLAVLMLVPIVYLIVALGRIQAGALAVEQGAREAARAFVTAPDEASAAVRAQTAAALAFHDQGFAGPYDGQLSVRCSTAPCLTGNGRVTVDVQITVLLPGVPRFLSHVIPVQMRLDATHVASVDEFSAP